MAQKINHMLQKIKQLLFRKKENLPNEYLSGISYRPDIQAIRLEIYKDVTIVYIQKPPTPGTEDPLTKPRIFEYNLFYKRKFYSDKASTLDELIEIAHNDIDTEFINKPQ